MSSHLTGMSGSDYVLLVAARLRRLHQSTPVIYRNVIYRNVIDEAVRLIEAQQKRIGELENGGANDSVAGGAQPQPQQVLE